MNELDAKWIHPNNVCIEGNRIMKKTNDTNWNAVAFSEQYLNFKDSGSIEFKVPGFDDDGNKTCDWTQMFFVGFSDGANNPDPQKNTIGVVLQQYAKCEGDKTPRMALEIYQQCGHISKTNAVYPGQKITINLSYMFNEETKKESIVWKITWINKDASNQLMEFKGRVCNAHLPNPLVAKIALYNGPKVVKNVKLTGDWKTVSDCTNVPFYPCKEDGKEFSCPKIHVFPNKWPEKLPRKEPIPIDDICKYIIGNCEGCGTDVMCMGDIIRVPMKLGIDSVQLLYNNKVIVESTSNKKNKSIDLVFPKLISAKDSENYTLKFI